MRLFWHNLAPNARAMCACVFLIGVAGCYESHQLSGSTTDASSRNDAGAVGEPFADAGPVEGCEGELVLLDQAEVGWPSADCGGVADPQVVSVSGEAGPFQLVVTEERVCDDRPGFALFQRLAIVDDRIDMGEEQTMGPAFRTAYAGSNGDQFAVCAGNALYVADASGLLLNAPLREQPSSLLLSGTPSAPRYRRTLNQPIRS